MNIEIWSVGRNGESFYEEGLHFYLNRIKPFTNAQLILIPPDKKAAKADEAHTKILEANLILQKLQPHHHLILLDEMGKMLTSPQWAEQLQNCMNRSVKTLVLLIGGAYGVSPEVRAVAKQVWSLSPQVFPHQMVRLIVAEQIYRAYSILHHLPYHHA